MLGHLYWSGETESVQITEGVEKIVVQGMRLEAKVEEKGIRLSKVEIVSNKQKQQREAILNFENEIKHRHEDLATVNKDLKEINARLNTTEDENEEEELFKEFKQKKAIKKKHEKELEKLEAQTTLNVHYQVRKTGVFDILPAGSYVLVDFLSKPICWCPRRPPCVSSEEVEDRCEEIPISMTSAEHTTATGDGLERCSLKQEAKFVITANDNKGQPRDAGGDAFVVESSQMELNPSVVDNGNGTYNVSYVADESKKSKFSLSVLLRGLPIRGSPFSISISTELTYNHFRSLGLFQGSQEGNCFGVDKKNQDPNALAQALARRAGFKRVISWNSRTGSTVNCVYVESIDCSSFNFSTAFGARDGYIAIDSIMVS